MLHTTRCYMRCDAMRCYAMLCYAMLCYAMLRVNIKSRKLIMDFHASRRLASLHCVRVT